MLGPSPALREELAKIPIAEFPIHSLADQANFQRLSLRDLDLKETVHREVTFEESAFDRVELGAAQWHKLNLSEVLIQSCSLANARCCDGSWESVLCSKSRLTGLNLAGNQINRVRFEGCKIDLSVWHDVIGTSCEFDRCDLREADFQGATLKDCVFRSCDLRGARFPAGKLERIDWRGSHIAGIVIDPGVLQETTIDPGQLLEVAHLMGLDVRTLDSDEVNSDP